MPDLRALAVNIKQWSAELGFQQAGIADVDLSQDETHLRDWLAQGQHGRMEYMARHGDKRSRPAELQPGTMRVISVRMDYGTGEDAACHRQPAQRGNGQGSEIPRGGEAPRQ